MATIKEIVIARLSEFSVSLATNTIDSYITASGIDGSQTFTLENAISVDSIMYQIIPLIMTLPKISEGQYSREYVVSGLLAYYKSLCVTLGLPDKLTPQPKIQNASNRW